MALTLVTAVELGGEGTTQKEDEEVSRDPALVAAQLELLRARAEKLDAETRVLHEMASCYEAEARRYNAEADLKATEAQVRKSEWDSPDMRKLLLQERITEVVRNIRRNRDDAAKYKHRTNRGSTPVARSGPRQPMGQRGGRVDQKTAVSPQTTVEARKTQ